MQKKKETLISEIKMAETIMKISINTININRRTLQIQRQRLINWINSPNPDLKDLHEKHQDMQKLKVKDGKKQDPSGKP